MNNNKNIFATLLFYNLLDHPLTLVEIYRYLFSLEPLESKSGSHQAEKIWLSDILKNIPKKVLSRNGFYFLEGKKHLLRERIKKEKIAAQKWKKIKNICPFLQIIPFVRGMGISGSLTFYNTKNESDFDLLVIAKTGRIWTTRALISIFLSLIGKKRYGLKTKDRVCLNCFLTEKSLKFKPEIEPHNVYLAQEYARIIPIFETENGLWQEFKKTNSWIRNYLYFYPWFDLKFYRISTIQILRLAREAGEQFLNLLDNSIEFFLKKEQIERIKKNLTNSSDDQIFFSDQYLFFHPQAKGRRLLKEFHKVADNPKVVPRYKSFDDLNNFNKRK